jgi:hypothetical protein
MGNSFECSYWWTSFDRAAFLFRVKYIVLMVANAFMMEIELENAETNERWRCEYTAEGTFQVLLFFSSCGITYRSFVHTAGIEKMTLKAGYIKRLSEFVDMLAQAFTKSDNNLSVNVITTSDLVMKSAQLPNAQNHLGLQNVDQSSALYRKRYIILIYQGPFDKKAIQYPLTLPFEEQPNPAALKRTIARLRKKVVDIESQEREPNSERERFDPTFITIVCCVQRPPRSVQGSAADGGETASREPGAKTPPAPRWSRSQPVDGLSPGAHWSFVTDQGCHRRTRSS